MREWDGEWDGNWDMRMGYGIGMGNELWECTVLFLLKQIGIDLICTLPGNIEKPLQLAAGCLPFFYCKSRRKYA